MKGVTTGKHYSERKKDKSRIMTSLDYHEWKGVDCSYFPPKKQDLNCQKVKLKLII